MDSNANDPLKQKFRPDIDAQLQREIDDALGDLSVEDLYEQADHSGAAPAAAEPGMRRGKIIAVDKDQAFVDLGGKSQGIIPLQQFESEPQVGQVMDFVVDRYDAREGLLLLNIKGAKATNVNWQTLEIGQIVDAVVTGHNKGGLELEVKGMRAFMPAGQVELFHVPEFAQYVGQRISAEVAQFDRESKNLILSRRNILEREKESAKKKLLEELAEGQTRRGTVRSVMDYGAFVDLGGVDGLLHVSEMSFRRVKDPREVVKEGDIVEVKITKLDKESGKLSLSLKQAKADPWSSVGDHYAVGSTLTGRVTRLEAFGAFIEVEEGIEGLLPISEMSWQRIKHPSDMLKEGDTLKLVVLSVDPANRRMSFSLKQAGADPWASVAERYATEMIVTGQVTRVADFGAFVQLEPGIEGLVHISELSTQRVRATSDVVKEAQEVRVSILEVDKANRRISLSIKRAAESPAVLQAAPSSAPPAAKKKRPELRGGLEFDMKKNK